MEFKHIIFILAVIGIIPLSFLLMISQKCLKACVFLLPICFWNYNATAINFFTNPEYKGTSLGYEISVMHLLSIAILLGMYLRRWPIKFIFPGNIAFFVYFFVCALSLLGSPNKVYSGFELMKMLMLYIVFLAVTNYMYATHDFDAFLNGLACVIIISFYLAFKMKYFGGRVQVKGLFPHQNSAGMFMCLLGPIFLARLLNRKESIFKITFYLAVFLMSFLSALFTYSRGTLACFPLGCFIVIIFSLALHFTPKTLIVICATTIIGLFAALYSAPNIVKRFTHAPEASANTRKLLAQIAMNIIKDKPLLGCGINTWGIVGKYLKYNTIQLYHTFRGGDYIGLVETTYLLVGAECGLLGLGALLFWYFYYLYQTIYQAYRWRKTEYFYLLAGLGGGLTANYLQSTLEWVLKQQINFCTLFCCFGIIAVLIQGAREHTTLSYLEALAQRRQEYLRQRQIAEEEARQAQQDQLRAMQETQLLAIQQDQLTETQQDHADE